MFAPKLEFSLRYMYGLYPQFSAYDNGQSSDIFRPIKAFDRSNQIWSVKYSIHYQWESL